MGSVPDFMLPNYSGGSLVNLVASIVQACGGEPRHPVLAALPAAELSGTENIVLVIISRQIVHSDYNVRTCAGAERRAYESLEGFVDETVAAVQSGPERKFVYAYWPHYDVTSHRHGSESREAAEQFEKFDRAFGSLITRLSGTQSRIVATADHGFIDVAPEESLELPAELAAMLRFPLCGERRIAYCYVHSPAQFMDRARQWLGDRADVRPSSELLRA